MEKEDAPEIPGKDTEKASQVLTQALQPMSVTLKNAVKKAVADTERKRLNKRWSKIRSRKW